MLVPLLTLAMMQQTSASRHPASEIVRHCEAWVRTNSRPSSAPADSASVNDSIQGVACIGFTEGFFEGIASSVDTLRICFPAEGTSTEVRVKVFLAYMEKNPKYLDSDRDVPLCWRGGMRGPVRLDDWGSPRISN
jgi:hypothetical protein